LLCGANFDQVKLHTMPIYELWRDVILVVINEAHAVIAKSLNYSVESFFFWLRLSESEKHLILF